MKGKSLIALVFLIGSCQAPATTEHEAKPRLAGGRCEGCEAILEPGNKPLAATDTLTDFMEPGPRIKVTGIIYQPDGKTPAKGVVLYVYHTNQQGIYPVQQGATGWQKQHGYLRGYVKTGADGRYTFYTLQPGPYPGRDTPAHIHPTLLEPDGKYYYVEDFYFAGDPLLSPAETNPKTPRGGSAGVLHLVAEDGLLTGTRDFILGRNVPGYPEENP